ncbi:class A beta-lactamase-related serine hydrolase [Amnibacterium sp. CER49]|uniref:class A beta-lactamase-related serine hydrolase n=1 Tax=Amnibacterium sp. CER49 TaxID=3039161 RepID=UPI0024497428|nr:class A beta-lactamase-related serine hydrolase [Amnibacterium sp. CER49]MDH2443589.1 class A beta-lactamase-related serine hydrolase [Amnibacterium sp. CER49]
MTAAQTESGRRARLRGDGSARHRGDQVRSDFSAGFTALAHLALTGAQVSARVIDLKSGRALFSVDDHVVLPTAHVGKVLLLVEVAARLDAAVQSKFDLLDRTPDDLVGDSGVWQYLHAPSLPLTDLAALVAATSDNLATNVLLRSVGLDAVRARAEELGLKRTALLDKVRDRRGPDDAPQLSVGSAAELTTLFARIARGEAVNRAVSSRVSDWLALNADLSMVASAFALDPLAHVRSDHGLSLLNKTGADRGIRSEAGVLRGPRASVAYTVTITFEDDRHTARLGVLNAMRTIGLDILEYVH